MTSDLLFSLNFLVIWVILGLSFLPLTFFLFKDFFDKGYIFSRILGISILSYLVFIVGVFKIAVFSTITIWILFFFSAILNLFLIKKGNFSISKKVFKIFAFEEFLFIVSFLFMTYVRAHNPDIHGLEKYMDFGFINSILRADYFPPKDMWLTPYFINYYYFGHLITAIMTKISGINSAITYNLMLASLFAMTFTASFSIVLNLIYFIYKNKKASFNKTKAITGGILAGFLVSLSGNIQSIYSLFSGVTTDKVTPFWQFSFSPFTFPNAYWYPTATRFIYNTIHEFPGYSWVVSDLHGHVLDIPIVLLFIALLFSFYKNVATASKKVFLPLLGFLMAIMYMTNTWDAAIYLLLAGAMLSLCYLTIPGESIWKKIINLFFSLTIVFLSFFIFSYPFNSFFKPFVSGIGLLCAPQFLIDLKQIGPFIFEANHCQTSPFWQLAILYGFFYFFVFSFLIFILKIKKTSSSDMFIFILIIVSSILILIPEFIYVKDIYPDHYRANTMFKLTYQAFILLSLSCAYIIFRVSNFLKPKISLYSFLWFMTTAILLFFVMSYPFLAINSYYNNLKIYKGLNGLKYLEELSPDDYTGIIWLNKNVKNQPVILEAQGDSYTDHARISANTGLPTVLGWTVHEWLWRGSYNIPASRIDDVKALYETEDSKNTTSLINKYDIRYVFVGKLEKDKYSISEDKFKKIGEIVFENGNTKIYKLN
ncbi:hypothetical protein KKG52_03445 [Patescibacteria group bacterium]|nr:hypothetical protein [Patescibacteria group bacterium]